MNPCILFVDDEAPIREMLSLYFRKKGYDVTTAVTCREARDAVQGGKFDLAIVDINLAGENGLELLDHFRSRFPELPVIMFTGLTGDDTLLDQAMSRGAAAFMRKTDSLDELFAVTQAHARRSGV